MLTLDPRGIYDSINSSSPILLHRLMIRSRSSPDPGPRARAPSQSASLSRSPSRCAVRGVLKAFSQTDLQIRRHYSAICCLTSRVPLQRHQTQTCSWRMRLLSDSTFSAMEASRTRARCWIRSRLSCLLWMIRQRRTMHPTSLAPDTMHRSDLSTGIMRSGSRPYDLMSSRSTPDLILLPLILFS